jgi:hypothetical protein
VKLAVPPIMMSIRLMSHEVPPQSMLAMKMHRGGLV